MTTFLKEISGTPGSGTAHIVFTNGVTSNDLQCANFFMTMQDRGMTLEEARSYARVGSMLSPTVDWNEIKRILDTF